MSDTDEKQYISKLIKELTNAGAYTPRNQELATKYGLNVSMKAGKPDIQVKNIDEVEAKFKEATSIFPQERQDELNGLMIKYGKSTVGGRTKPAVWAKKYSRIGAFMNSTEYKNRVKALKAAETKKANKDKKQEEADLAKELEELDKEEAKAMAQQKAEDEKAKQREAEFKAKQAAAKKAKEEVAILQKQMEEEEKRKQNNHKLEKKVVKKKIQKTEQAPAPVDRSRIEQLLAKKDQEETGKSLTKV